MIRRVFALLAATAAAVPAALWIVHREKMIQQRGRRLHPEEFDFARSLRICHPKEIRIQSLPAIPSPLGGWLTPLENWAGFSLSSSAGVTLGYGIYVAEGSESLALVSHELVHVRQYEHLGGPLPFIFRYFYECLLYGYSASPLEQEAIRLSKH